MITNLNRFNKLRDSSLARERLSVSSSEPVVPAEDGAARSTTVSECETLLREHHAVRGGRCPAA